MRIPVVCMECGKKFKTAKVCPECPKCGGVDIDLDWAKASKVPFEKAKAVAEEFAREHGVTP